MSKRPELPESIRKLVADVGTPVTPEDVDTFGRLQDIQDRSHWTRTIVNAWKNQQTQDRKMRKQYATALMVAMGVQIVVINVLFILIGFGKLTYEPWTAKVFIMAVFAEVAAMVFFIVKYLFRSTGDKVLELVKPGGRAGRKGRGKRDAD